MHLQYLHPGHSLLANILAIPAIHLQLVKGNNKWLISIDDGISVVSDILPGNVVLFVDKTMSPKSVRFLESTSPNIARNGTLPCELRLQLTKLNVIACRIHPITIDASVPTTIGLL